MVLSYKISSFTRNITVLKQMEKLQWIVAILILFLFLATIPFITGVKINNLDQSNIIKTLEKQGYTNIKIIDTQFVAGAPYHGINACFSAQYFTAEAINSVGESIEIHVYSAFPFKDVVEIKTK